MKAERKTIYYLGFIRCIQC